ncbi:MAG: hypothetical protein GXO24_03395 [Chlorobi bacterium]|nr:hypothetical protein [Chlorobiota bacterium]
MNTLGFSPGTVGLYVEKSSDGTAYRISLAVVYPEKLTLQNQMHTLGLAEGNIQTRSSREIFQQNDLHVLVLFEDIKTASGEVPDMVEGYFEFSGGIRLTYRFESPAEGFVAAKGTFTNPDEESVPEAEHLPGVYNLGILDYMKVEEEVCCYVPGEVSHIENIMAREYKERSTRDLKRTEITEEVTREEEIDRERDTVSTERFSLQREIEEVLQTQQQINTGLSLGTSASVSYSAGLKKGNASISATRNFNAYADMSFSTSKSRSDRLSTEFAREITEEAKLRILTKTVRKRTVKRLREFEEINKHGFDNRNGQAHVSGVYRWIDVVYKHRLFNYGKRLIYEFMIPEPSRHFIHSLRQQAETVDDCETEIIEKPLHPSELRGILRVSSARQINEVNYMRLAAYYGAEVTPPPPLYKASGVSFQKSQVTDGVGASKNKSEIKEIRVPEGYKAISAYIAATSVPHPRQPYYIGYTVGNLAGYTTNRNFSFHFTFSAAPTSVVPAGVYFSWVWTSVVTITVKFRRTKELYQKWQNEVYQSILDAYNRRKEAYEKSLQNRCIQEEEEREIRLNFNPLLNRIIERRELKRAAIEMMTAPFGIPVAEDHFTLGADGFYHIVQDAQFSFHARVVKFLEEAFEWDLVSYRFYPYYWAGSGQWWELMNRHEVKDPLFRAFLQSGMAKVAVPVRPGYEEAVLYYMQTGDIWTAGQLIVEDENDYYVSVVGDIKDEEPELIAEWFDRVPTSLTIIQKDAVGLNETGLPCCSDVEFDENGNPIQPENNLLGNDCTQNDEPA